MLDELENDIRSLELEGQFRTALARSIAKMRADFTAAIDALAVESPDEFFDALFNSSEDIVALSVMARAPRVPDAAFLALVRAVSRLGRNSAALIQEFTEMCSFKSRAAQPRRHRQSRRLLSADTEP